MDRVTAKVHTRITGIPAKACWNNGSVSWCSDCRACRCGILHEQRAVQIHN